MEITRGESELLSRFLEVFVTYPSLLVCPTKPLPPARKKKVTFPPIVFILSKFIQLSLIKLNWAMKVLILGKLFPML
jgi:hypothetical protein